MLCVALFIMSQFPLILSATLDSPNVIILSMVAILFVMIGFGVFIIIPVSSRNDSYNTVIQEGEFPKSKRFEYKRIEKICSVYWPLVTAIYIGWSLITMDWGRTWIIWPVSAISFAAIIGLSDLLTNDKI